MKRKPLSLAIKITIILLSGMILFACSSEKASKPSILGSWESIEAPGCFYSFEEENRGFFDSNGLIMNFTYKTDGNKVEITWEGSADPQIWQFKVENGLLAMKDLDSDTMLTYKKK